MNRFSLLKRSLAMLLSLVMVLGAVPLDIFAAETSGSAETATESSVSGNHTHTTAAAETEPAVVSEYQEGTAIYKVGTEVFYYLDLALAAAGTNGTVTVTESGIAYHSQGANEFTIPAGVSLVISHKSSGKPNSATNAHPYALQDRYEKSSNLNYVNGTYAKPTDSTTKCKLTLPENAKLTVKGYL